MTTTNANSTTLAALLADASIGTFTGLVITKVGAERGPASAKVRYGDDTVHACIVTGFRYAGKGGLCDRALTVLETLDDATVLAEIVAKGTKAWEGRGAKAVETAVTLADMATARAELTVSLTKSRDDLNESTTDAVFEPLVVDGETVRSARVYTGQTPEAKAAGVKEPATPGTIYLQGLQISSKTLVPAVNGPVPAAQSGAVTVAKDALTKHLPTARYVQYKLQPGAPWLLRVGGAAAAAASADGMDFSRVGELLARCA